MSESPHAKTYNRINQIQLEDAFMTKIPPFFTRDLPKKVEQSKPSIPVEICMLVMLIVCNGPRLIVDVEPIYQHSKLLAKLNKLMLTQLQHNSQEQSQPSYQILSRPLFDQF